jgi:predicted lysophospholipase L1 biosynthesis ABC-type transport system permease subunit
MPTALAWSNVRSNRTSLVAAFTAITLAVMLVAGAGLLLTSAHDDGRLRDLMSLFAVTAGLSGFVSIFVVAGTLSLHVLQQRRTWGLLRSVGMTPGQVRRLVVAKALTVAAVACVAGSALAVPQASVTAAVLTRVGLAPEGFEIVVAAPPFIVGTAVGIVVTLLAALAASGTAARVGPLEVLRDSAAQARALPWQRVVVGATALAGGGVLLRVTSTASLTDAVPLGVVVTMALCVAGSAFGPVLLRVVGGLLAAPIAALDPGPGALARAAVTVQPRRAAAVASPVMLTVALACTFVFAIAIADTSDGRVRAGVQLWAVILLIGTAVVFTMISVLNSTAMSMSTRAPELRLLRSTGATPRQLARALCWESLIATCSGALVGTLIAVVSLGAVSLAGTGAPWFGFSLPLYLALVGLCAAGGVLGALLSTRRARRGALVTG